MMLRVISLVLMLATVFSVLGCAGIGVVARDEIDKSDKVDNADNADNAIAADVVDSLATERATERPGELLNFAQTDESGEPLYRIVHKINATEWLIEQCALLASAIYDATGVSVPVVHEMEGNSPYEILVGDVARTGMVELKDSVAGLGKDDFQIRTVENRVWVYGTTDHAIVTGMLLLIDQFAWYDAQAKEFGVSSDFEYLYQPMDRPPVQPGAIDEHSVELELLTTDVLYTYVRLSFTGKTGWRIQTKLSKEDAYNDFGAAQRLAYSLGETVPADLGTVTTSKIGNLLTVTATDGSRVEINTDRFELNFYTPSNKLASTITSVTANRSGSSIAGRLIEGEAIFGTGERFNSANQRGEYIEMFTKDIWSKANACYMVIPLLCSSRGSGIFINLYEHMTLDLGKEVKDEWKAVVTAVQLDVYVFTTETIPEVITAYSDLTGYAERPEEWSYGMLVCGKNPDLSQKWTASLAPSEWELGEGVYEMIANMEAYDLPWTGVIAEPWDYPKTSKHSDLKELCDYVHSLGKKFLVYMSVGNVKPGMLPEGALQSQKFGSFSNDYYLTQTVGDEEPSYNLPDTTAGTNNPDVGEGSRTSVYLDITNPNAVTWFFDEYWEYLKNDIGVDGCKLDFCETLPENYPLNYYDKSMPTSGSHHWYPTAFCTMFYDMISAKPDSGMCYTRGGGIGAQRAPYMWAGDQVREYVSLEYQLSAVLSSGLSGVPYMSYDMSGYSYGKASKELSYESQVFLRGTQFTAFTICMQTHGKVRRAYHFEQADSDYAYVTDIYRAYTKLHEHLTPYITELCAEASTTGMPVMRHLVLHYQNDTNVYDIEDEYMFGDAFLIAPILDESFERKIYLPEGKWLDLNTDEVHVVPAGGKWIEHYSASLAELPTFYNVDSSSEIAETLIPGIQDIYDYARSMLPEENATNE